MLNNRPLTRQEAINVLWHKGILHWKLHQAQKELYDSYKNAVHRTLVWTCSRRLGKSFALCLIAIEKCLSKPNVIVKYVAPEQKQVRTIITPLIRQILQDCPVELQPKYMTQQFCYRFPNGSEIQLAGSDSGNAESLRGGSSDLCIIDEAGFCDELEYVVQSILLPTTATTNGKIILASTPPKTPDHAFRKYVERAIERGILVKKTIYDNPMLTPAVIEELKAEAGGEKSAAWKREYLCQNLVDQESAVVPEFTEELKDVIIKDWKRPPYYDTYVAMDIGVNDFTFVLFGYYDFRAGKVIIEDEFLINGQQWNTESLAKGIKEREKYLCTDRITLEQVKPYKRISDTNLTVLNDLRILHGLEFNKTPKDDAEAALNNMRVKLGQAKIIISPRCTKLIRHLEFAIWNKSRTKYERSADDGHYDGVDALKYLIRNIDFNRNPYPKHYDLNLNNNNAFYYKETPKNLEVYKKIFNVKRINK